ncbi:aminotransferase class V-fold PLP-dependent enzyme [Spiroplasma gladiatoris]|uniref:Aminotransferase class V-fold PLP-dependent enzyme n=1 Tax=Spiroplasma gladiatoris TaxID=2143 RepID=A0A4P7AIQ7_9MOLU|nr:aminotransferase class V-fold PLP-dependent enzyme [Spiroplasma gladiatoris]QBQ08152.1 aminotransferase class V-fold PLP-dependent enzyme [Spiroplasma gladiatoris]
MKKKIIFTPGPQTTKGNIKRQSIFHRSVESQEIVKKTKEVLCKEFGSKEVLIAQTSASELINIFSLSLKNKVTKNNKIAVIDTGNWSENIVRILESNKFIVNKIDKSIFDKSKTELENFIASLEETLVFGLLNETSTGCIYDYKNIYKEIKKQNKYLFIDAVSYPIFYRKENNLNQECDFLLMSSAKSFHSNPGFSFLGYSKSFEEYDIFENNYYFSLHLMHKFSKINQLPHTYFTNNLQVVCEDIEFTLNNKDKITKKINVLKDKFIEEMSKLGFLVNNKKDIINSNLIVLICPQKIKASELISFMYKNNIFVGGDQANLNSIRVCINYHNNISDVKILINSTKNLK